MKKKLFLLSAVLLAAAAGIRAQIYSFETPQADAWSAENARLSYSAERFKLGKRSLRIDWGPGAVVRIGNPMGLEQAAGAPNGGIALWIYNERPAAEPLHIVFRNAEGADVCEVACELGFRGWRCVWNKFREDMGKSPKEGLSDVEIRFPEIAGGGTVYLDCLEFSRNVSWQKMSDFQVRVNRTDFSLIPDFMKYRRAEPDPARTVQASPEQVARIAGRLERWYLGPEDAKGAWVERRRAGEAEFIRRGVRAGGKYAMTEPLYPMRTPKTIDGEQTLYFMDLNKNVLLPLALDYRKNGSKESLERLLWIYDWFNDQGWADGSGLGSLCFEKLRSAGYFHSLFLLRDDLPAATLARELNTLRWLTMFGICYFDPGHPGEVADNLRALALPKLVYALLLPEGERETALTAFRDYMNNALGFGPGYFGTFKSDGSGYHHRGAYNSAYYPHALYAGALVAYLLHDTPYALSAETLHNLKRGLLTYRFFCAGLCVPAGTAGRFPLGQEVLQELLPAFSYAAYAFPEPDADLLAAVKRLLRDYPAQVGKVLDQVDSDLSYTATVGEAELLERAWQSPVKAEEAPCGALFMPYSGLLVVRNSDIHFNVKGFSKYIWDFESSDTENLAGRYLSNGQVEYFDLRNGVKSFNPQSEDFDWSLIPGTTSILLPYDVLKEKKHRKGFSDHRNYSDESFLAGVAADARTAMFSFRMHARAYDGDLRADKSVFFFGDTVLCMGSGIRCDDAANPTVTTLFQSCGDGAPGRVRRTAGGTLATDHAGIVYAVKDAGILLDEKGAFTRARLDHGTAPQGASYLYYMLPKSGRKAAARLLSDKGPVEVVRQDAAAHIVRLRTDGTLFAALYDAETEYPELPVTGVNIPLAYIWQECGGGSSRLSLCEPDMRRPAVDHMGQLTEAQVVIPEQPFATRLRLHGLFEASCVDGDVRTTCADGETTLELTTVRGRNYTIELKKR